MGTFYLLVKDNEIIHTWSKNLAAKYESEGWKYVGYVHGWNTSFTPVKKEAKNGEYY